MPFILNLILFILCLSVLIAVHELGHLCAAKAFKVYCFEYSIGFGPALFRTRRKGGETFFSVRAIPFGGFVSMYGEQNGEAGEKPELPDGIESIPDSRSLATIKKWKKAIILAAGVFLNAVLALLLFFVSNGPWFVQQQMYLHQINVSENSVAATAGLTVGDDFDKVYAFQEPLNSEDVDLLDKNSFQIFSYDSIATFDDSTTKPVVALFSENTNNWSFKNRTLDSHLFYFELGEENKINFDKQITAETQNLARIDFKISFYNIIEAEIDGKTQRVIDKENPVSYTLPLNVTFDGTNENFDSTGISALLYSYRHSFGEAIGQSFIDFGESSIMIGKALGNLVIGRGWNDVGGPVAIFNQSSKMLTDFGITQFIDLWAMISVNLAIFNLIPFPGLDGWQLLVVAIEGISKRKMPEKVQQIVSLVGMILLFAFMAFILIKDVIFLF